MTDTPVDPLHSARTVLRSAVTGALGTLTEAGTPFTSLVTVATAMNGAPVLLISRLAVHTRNLDRDGRCSLLLVAPGGEGGDPLAGARLTVEGTAARIPPDTAECAHARGRFLARHPAAEGYAFFADFGMVGIAVEKAHLVAGFGRIHTIAGADLLAPPELAAAFADAEPSIVGHMNEDHADSVALYATRLLGQGEGAWRVVGADPDGLDLACGDRVARLPFRARQTNVMHVRSELKALSETARAAL